MDYKSLDRIVDYQSQAVIRGFELIDYGRHADNFLLWVVDLGRREGEWMKGTPE